MMVWAKDNHPVGIMMLFISIEIDVMIFNYRTATFDTSKICFLPKLAADLSWRPSGHISCYNYKYKYILVKPTIVE
ncbi:hypothetical protein C443_05694 [Haloarcula argentinensis DSM 12282]|nr:hypothetical protein C443_05694 [Haloarcula argentinensis DSM 12282]